MMSGLGWELQEGGYKDTEENDLFGSLKNESFLPFSV